MAAAVPSRWQSPPTFLQQSVAPFLTQRDVATAATTSKALGKEPEVRRERCRSRLGPSGCPALWTQCHRYCSEPPVCAAWLRPIADVVVAAAQTTGVHGLVYHVPLLNKDSTRTMLPHYAVVCAFAVDDSRHSNIYTVRSGVYTSETSRHGAPRWGDYEATDKQLSSDELTQLVCADVRRSPDAHLSILVMPSDLMVQSLESIPGIQVDVRGAVPWKVEWPNVSAPSKALWARPVGTTDAPPLADRMFAGESVYVLEARVF